MKKKIIILFALCLAFTSCISTKVTPPKEDEVSIHIDNDCAWELDLNINRIIGFPTFIKLGNRGKTLNLKKNKTYIISVKSRLDFKSSTFFVKTKDYDTTWRIVWDSFDGKYYIYY